MSQYSLSCLWSSQMQGPQLLQDPFPQLLALPTSTQLTYGERKSQLGLLNITAFIFKIFIYLFMAALGLSCGKWDPHCRAWA